MLRNALFTLLLAVSTAPAIVSADTLLLDGVNSSNESAEARPRRGMSMDDVREQWGTPTLEARPIGDPPIARWEYADFIVYFEYSTVLHTVVRKPAS